MLFPYSLPQGFPGGIVVKNLPSNAEDRRGAGFDLQVGKIPWRRKWLPSPVSLPGKPYGQRSLVGYSSWSCKESDMTEHIHAHMLFFAKVEVTLNYPENLFQIFTFILM